MERASKAVRRSRFEAEKRAAEERAERLTSASSQPGLWWLGPALLELSMELVWEGSGSLLQVFLACSCGLCGIWSCCMELTVLPLLPLQTRRRTSTRSWEWARWRPTPVRSLLAGLPGR